MLKCTFCQEIGFEGDESVPCPRCKGTDTVLLPEPPPCLVTIKFAESGSALFAIEQEGQITPGQLAAAGQYLSFLAWLNLAIPNLVPAIAEAVSQKLKEPQIAVPGLGVGPILKGMRGD